MWGEVHQSVKDSIGKYCSATITIFFLNLELQKKKEKKKRISCIEYCSKIKIIYLKGTRPKPMWDCL